MALALRKNNNRSPVGLDLDGAFLAAVQTPATASSAPSARSSPPA